MRLAEVSTTLSTQEVSVKRYARRKGKTLAFHGVQGVISRPFIAFAHTMATAMTVLMERLYYHIIDGVPTRVVGPDWSVVEQALALPLAKFKANAPFVASWSFQQFVESVHGRKRTLYENACKRLAQGWTWGDVAKWSHIRAFIKHEKLEVKPKRMVPRLVQPRSPEYNVLVGRYIKAAEKPVFETLQSVVGSNTPVVGKGMNVKELGGVIDKKFHSFRNCVAVGLDMNRFDQHITQNMLRYEHKYYQALFHSRELARLLRHQLCIDGKLFCDEGHIKYTIDGCRCSGDMNTSLGNTIIMTALVDAYCCRHGIPYDCIVNGDDTVVFFEKRFLERFGGFVPFCETLGFSPKVEEPVSVLEQVSFCQMQPVFDGEQYVMCRAYPTCVNKDAHTTYKVNPTNCASYYSAIGQAGLALTSGLPVVQEYYSALYALGCPDDIPDEAVSMRMWGKGMLPTYKPVSAEARYSFYLAFGMTPDEQEAAEEAFRALPKTVKMVEEELMPLWGADRGA